ncbi:hypothetical protein F5B20DRAFT_553563 [Whalleya microplaca]|nr:hypothetical protein F5B20DRAFT_553563 [Whalleya microplaca]
MESNDYMSSRAQEYYNQDTTPSKPPRRTVPSSTTLAVPGQDSYFTFQPHAPGMGIPDAKDNFVSPISPSSPYSPISPSLFPLPPNSTGPSPDPHYRAPSPGTWYSASSPGSVCTPSPCPSPSPTPSLIPPPLFPQPPPETHHLPDNNNAARAALDVPKFATGPLARSPSGDSTFRLDASRAESRKRSNSERLRRSSGRNILDSPSTPGFREPRFSLGPYSPTSPPAPYPGLGLVEENSVGVSGVPPAQPSPARSSFTDTDSTTPIVPRVSNRSSHTLTKLGGAGAGAGAGVGVRGGGVGGGKLDSLDEEAQETMSVARHRISKRRRQILIFTSISLTGLAVVVAVVVGIYVAMSNSHST